MGNIGRWLFLAGLVICVVVGLGLANNPWVPAALAILGVIVGLLNIQSSETTEFLIATISLIICASALTAIPYIGQTVLNIVAYLVVFMAAAVVVVSIRSLLKTASD